MGIQSITEVAQSIASQIASSSSAIMGVGAPSKDSESSYNGNNDASSHIDYEADYSSQVAGKLSEFVSLVHSMAAEFEAKDAELSQAISSQSAEVSGTSSSGRNSLLAD